MKTMHLDPIGGLAGDMLCAALLDAGLDEQQWRDTLGCLDIPETKISISKTKKWHPQR